MSFNNAYGLNDADVALYTAYYENTGDKDKSIEALLYYYGQEITRRIVQESEGQRIELVYKDGFDDRMSTKYVKIK